MSNERKEKRTPKISVRLETVECATCSINFSLPEHFVNQRRKDGSQFHCPVGHINVYRKTTQENEIEALKKERDELKAEVSRLKERLSRFATGTIEVDADAA